MVSEDFSFPAIFSSSDDLSHQSAIMASSSLWRISSKVKANLDAELGGNGSRRKISRRSFCSKGEYHYYGGSDDWYSMDLLWENFNEEICSERLCDTHTEIETDFEGIERNGLGNVSKEINVLKASKKLRMVTVLKAVKKLLILRNMARLKRRELDS